MYFGACKWQYKNEETSILHVLFTAESTMQVLDLMKSRIIVSGVASFDITN